MSATLGHLKITAKCKENYYGKRCSVYCKPHADDNYGFYQCNQVTGEKECLQLVMKRKKSER